MIASVAGPILGGIMGGESAGDAADAQSRSVQEANDLQWRMYDQNRTDQTPWREAGGEAVNMLRSGIQPGGQFMQSFGMDQFKADPGYGFRLSEGLKSIERSAAARGNLLSGGVLKGITRYGQDLASNEYQNAYNRFNQDQGNQYNRLAGVAGTGQTAVNQLGQAGQNLAQNVGNNLMGAGNARASGYVGSANALSSGLANAYGNYQGNQILNMLRPQGQSQNYGYGAGGYSGAYDNDVAQFGMGP